MPEINYIKHLRNNEDLSISEISKKIGCNWRTAKRYADGDVPLPSIGYYKRGMMYDGGFGEIVDYWLEEDMKLKKKERRKNKKIYEQLKNEHEFPGSYRTVCDYIQHRKPQLKVEKEKRYEHLEHPPGEAQVDFGGMTVVKDGEYKDIDALILSFPYSNAGFAYPLPAQNTECFLEGMKRLFHQIKGIPTHIRMDNLSAAIISIGKGENRKYTDAFLAFQAHYGFEVQPCNPASGHEKGNVEKKVGYTRDNFFVTAPIMEDFEQLASWLKDTMIQDRQRQHYEKQILIEELWEEEKTKLKVLPLKDFPVFTIDKATVNKYGEITIDKESVFIPHATIKRSVTIKKEWNQFSCISNDGEILYEAPRPYMHTTRPMPWDIILEDWSIKPRAVSYSRFFKYLPEKVQIYLTFHRDEVKKRVIGLRELLANGHTLKEMEEVLQLESRLEREPHELGYILEAKQFSYQENIHESYTPPILLNHETDLAYYDKKLCPVLEGRA